MPGVYLEVTSTSLTAVSAGQEAARGHRGSVCPDTNVFVSPAKASPFIRSLPFADPMTLSLGECATKVTSLITHFGH